MDPAMWPFLGSSLLFLGSLAASGVAFYGVHKNNQTNRAAIIAADERAVIDRAETREREFRSWQRDTMLRLSTEVIEAALNCEDDYRRIGYYPKQMEIDSADVIEEAGRKIGVCGLNLRLIGAHEAADRCRDLRSVSNSRALLGAMLDFHQAHLKTFAPEHANDPDMLAEVEQKRVEFEGLLGYLNTVRGEFGETVERELHRLSFRSELPAAPVTG